VVGSVVGHPRLNCYRTVVDEAGDAIVRGRAGRLRSFRSGAVSRAGATEELRLCAADCGLVSRPHPGFLIPDRHRFVASSRHRLEETT